MSFDAVLGHNRQLEIIKRAVTCKKVHHAYLFTGIAGIGKKLVALKLAQALQCSASEDIACGRCTGCLKTRDGNHSDVIIIEPEGNQIKIDQVRELQKRLAFKPFEGRSNVAIIDGSDKMSQAAANSLLKTLEEPPQATYLILLAENIRQVLPTIISRCQKLRFNPLTTPDIQKILTEDHDLTADEALAAALMADGSPGKALTLLKSFPKGQRDEILKRIIDIKGIEDIFALAEELTGKKQVENLMESVELIKFFVRDVIRVKMGLDNASLINRDHIKAIKLIADRTSLNELIEGIEEVSKTEMAINMNVNKRLAIENMLIKTFKRDNAICSKLSA